jgi:hypothetical protein
MRWRGSKNRYELPGDLNPIDWATVVLVGFGIGLLIVALWVAR